ncbi:MAG: tetratricopeptide repeat protein [Deltaproteobacteria bacterium]|nr:tetratricopeptide repeat protein [Deltaproteobacteria bacterium]
MELELSDTEFKSFRDLIAERAGIYFEPSKQDLLRTNLLQRMEDCGLSNFADYFQLLSSPAGTKEFDHLLNLIIIPETYFFRDQAQFDAFEHSIIPEILKSESDSGSSLRIWSAGCSTGEEPYTIALLVAAGMGSVKYPSVHILATDVSSVALEAARRGVYGPRSVRDVPKEYLNRFFSKKKDKYHLDESIKKMVEFSYFNLMTEPYPLLEMSGWDIIFCRNVTIYFQHESTKKVIHNFYQSLRPGGYLFAGYSESLRYLSDEFTTVQVGGTFVYKKEPRGKSPKRKVRRTRRKRGRQRTPASGRSRRLEVLSDQRVDETQQICTRAKELLELGKPEQAGDLLAPYLKKSTASESVLLLQAEIFLNQGNLEKAVQLCERIINYEPLSVAGYYLLGLVYRTWKKEGKAIEEFKRVLYLNSEHALARFNLGDLYSEVGKRDEARIEYANVVRLLKEVPESFDERLAGGFSPTLLIDTCLSRIKELSESG